MPAVTDDDDQLLTAAFALYSNPGAYALLIGAGVSASSGVPTAWGVLEDLIRNVARFKGENPTDLIQWYENHFKEQPTYEGVLERLAPTPFERQRLLREFFEPSEEDTRRNQKAPTEAHRSIARLVRAGAVRLIITLNFDRLIERALRDAGIEPTVVTGSSDLKGVAPLHTLDCCVVHLHGDYLNPASMLNTVTELGEYDPTTVKFLQTVLENYGLIIAGWSATYDPALRRAIAEYYPARYTLTWIEPGVISDQAHDLRKLKNGLLLRTDADTGFGRLADGIDALNRRQSRHPLSVPVAVETAKRELSGGAVAIGLHDTLRQEFAKLHETPDFHLESYHNDDGYEAMVERVEEASRMSVALVATLAYWGDDKTDSWWIEELSRFATRKDSNGLTKLLSLRLISGGMLFYSAGVAAVASQRFDLLRTMYSTRMTDWHFGDQKTLAQHYDHLTGYEDVPNRDTRRFDVLSPIISEALGIGTETISDAWQLFEILRLTWVVMHHPQFPKLRDAYFEKNNLYRTAQRLTQSHASTSSGSDDQKWSSPDNLRSARDGILEQLARLVPMSRPHVLVIDRLSDAYQSDIAVRLINDLQAERQAHALSASNFVDDIDSLILAAMAVHVALGEEGERLAWADASGPGMAQIPTEVWLDQAGT